MNIHNTHIYVKPTGAIFLDTGNRLTEKSVSVTVGSGEPQNWVVEGSHWNS
ncbi:MAG: hypothetical protein Phyf2KO_06530 [Phycisphaerales bacterium]